jgi:RNA polymerase subunit RPABC4/transcription elongation factor Spt4
MNSKIFFNAQNQKCRISGIENRNGTWIATIYIIDTDKFVTRNYEQIKKYL